MLCAARCSGQDRCCKPRRACDLPNGVTKQKVRPILDKDGGILRWNRYCLVCNYARESHQARSSGALQMCESARQGSIVYLTLARVLVSPFLFVLSLEEQRSLGAARAKAVVFRWGSGVRHGTPSGVQVLDWLRLFLTLVLRVCSRHAPRSSIVVFRARG